MTTLAASRMEGIKLRSLRSTWWTPAVTVAGATAIAIAVGASTERGSGDLTEQRPGRRRPGPAAHRRPGRADDDQRVLLGHDPRDAGRRPRPLAAAGRQGGGLRPGD